MFATVLLSAAAAAKCPNAIIDVAIHAVPDTALRSCAREHADGDDRFEVKLERIDHWLKIGAQPSATVARLIKGSRKQAAPAQK